MESIVKKQLFLFSLLMLSFFSGSLAMQPEDVSLSNRYVIGVDLHDTYLQRDLMGFNAKIVAIIAQAPNKLELFRYAYWFITRGWQLSSLPEYSGSGQDVMDQLAREFPPILTIKDKILNAIDGQLHKPNPAMVKTIQELKAAGFKIVIVSNVSRRGLDGLKSQNPAEFALFDAEFVSDYPRKVTINGEEILVPKKPALEYYKILRTKFLDTDDRFKGKTMVFVDDSKKFIEGANAANVNIQGILFKNAEQFRQELVNKGLLTAQAKPEQSSYIDALFDYLESVTE